MRWSRRVCQQEAIRDEELRLGNRRRRMAAVLARLAVELVTQLGLRMAEAPRHLGGLDLWDFQSYPQGDRKINQLRQQRSQSP